MAKCKKCGAYAGLLGNICDDCNQKSIEHYQLDQEISQEVAQEHQADLEKRICSVILTTTPTIEGYLITDTIDIVTAECAFGMNVFRDLFAGVRDFVGGRSRATQKILRDTRITCLNELRQEADTVGANAVVGVDLDYSEFSGGGKSMLFLVASGTAVKVKSEEAQPD